MSQRSSGKLPPLVPRYLSLLRTAKFITNPIPILGSYLEEYGPTYLFHIGGFKKGFLTTNPEIIQHVLQKNHRNYRKSDIQTGLLAHYIGNGLLTSDGDYWLRQRRLIQPGFHRKRIAGLVPLINNEIDYTAKRWKKITSKNDPLDLYREMHLLAFRIVAKTLFSTGMSEAQMEQLSEQISAVQKFIVRQIRQPYAQWWLKLSGQVKYHEQLSQSTKGILINIIKQRLSSGKRENDLLQILIDARYEDDGTGMTLDQLLDECLIIFVAGHETTANALFWTFYLLAKNPDYIPMIREEAKTWHGTGHPSFDHLPNLPHSLQVIEESLRLYPPAWIIDRVAKEADKVAGYDIPKDTMMILYTYGTHHSNYLWADPEIFKPERFRKDIHTEIHPFAYFPFGGGPRLCIGNNFALMEMQLVLTQLYRHFDFELVSPDAKILPLITLRPAESLLFKVKPRL